ncbi:MAG: hypothetical protein D3903_13955 [Candidatus Electrothrix sp. GM3_4]|nr:hypothetical protein [Candidatus Electrothrix sp. GM3_4]
MSKSVQRIQMKDGGQLWVEVEEVDLPVELPTSEKERELPSNMPPGTEEIGFKDKVKEVGDKVRDVNEILRQSLSSIFETVAESVKEKQPDEWGVEVNIGFKGKTNPIPVILSGEANASIKVHAKWTKDKPEAQNG